MSATAANLSPEEYEQRKVFLDSMKILVKGEQEEVYRILKKFRCELSENSNGVFFDLCKLPAEAFEALQKFMEFCHQNRITLETRDEESRKAQEALFYGS